MRVWVVREEPSDPYAGDGSIEGIFTSREAAKRYLGSNNEYCYIEEYETDVAYIPTNNDYDRACTGLIEEED